MHINLHLDSHCRSRFSFYLSSQSTIIIYFPPTILNSHGLLSYSLCWHITFSLLSCKCWDLEKNRDNIIATENTRHPVKLEFQITNKLFLYKYALKVIFIYLKLKCNKATCVRVSILNIKG